MQSSRKAILILVFCCLLWGISFPGVKIGMAAFESHVYPGIEPTLIQKIAGNATFNGWRFLIGAIVYVALTWRRQRNFSRGDVRGGMQIGLFFSVAILAQLAGLAYTLPSISAFLTALVVVFAPLAQALLLKRPVRVFTWLAVLLALAGVVVLSQPDATAAVAGSHPPIPFLGEFFTVIAAIIFTAQLLTIDHYGQHHDSARMTLLMFLSTAVSGLIIGAALDGGSVYRAATLAAIFSDANFLLPWLGMALFSSVIAMHLMNTWQPRVSPASASVIYCTEPLFATFFSVMVGTESLSAAVLTGGIMIVAAVLIESLPAKAQAAAPLPVAAHEDGAPPADSSSI